MSTFIATSNFDTNVSSSLPSEFPTPLPTSLGSDFAANTDVESYPFHGALEGVDEGVVFEQNVNAVHTHPDSSFHGDDGTAQAHDISRDFTDWGCYNGYVSLGDIILNGAFGIRTPDPQQPWSLLDSKDSKVLQEYGNLNSPWCTHDVFAIKDSVGDLLHQDASDVDLWRQDQRRLSPDLVEEQDDHLKTPPSQCGPLRIVSEPTERQKRPQIVRDWLSAHASWPYPTPTEKSELIEATGYTGLQLNNCLSNLRTREKYLIDSHAIGKNDGNVSHSQ
ncbi:hypothetical protein AG0111_0g8709 [Alternaria gaisen]|uniref:Uncharacterized protein n=1 Tax=Alternaria gaisen TaxID=167740 RepID=A0ACB6FF46_9PLEO|nr:hypothetical protein AG0111_0g8709 [Alternaria gaisen]